MYRLIGDAGFKDSDQEANVRRIDIRDRANAEREYISWCKSSYFFSVELWDMGPFELEGKKIAHMHIKVIGTLMAQWDKDLDRQRGAKPNLKKFPGWGQYLKKGRETK